MSEVNKKISRYKAISIVSSLFLCVVLVNVLGSNDLSVGEKIVCGGVLFVTVFAVNIAYRIKIGSLTCPKCGKPVMTKQPWYDTGGLQESAYDKCYFCGFEFE